MPTLTIGEQKITVGDEFLRLSPEQQQSTVDEIHRSLPPAEPSAIGDVATSFGRGIAKGAIGLAGLPGDVGRLVGRGVETLGLPALESRLPSSEQITGAVEKVTGKFGEPQTTPERYAQSVGEFVPSALLQPGGLLTKAVTTIGGGIGARVGGDVAAALDLPEAVGAVVGGIVGGGAAGLGAAETQSMRLGRQLPTAEQIRAGAQQAYRAVENERLIVHDGAVNNLVSSLRAGLDQRLLTDVAPRTMRGVAQLETSGGDIAGIMGVRQRLGEIKPSAEADYEAAQHVRDAIDHFVETLPASEVVQGDAPLTQALLNEARSAWRAYSKLDQIHSAMEIGTHRAAVSGTGANTQNAMRQRIREIIDSDTKARGFSDASLDQMENIVMGTWLTNSARWAGKYAPSGPVSTMASGLAWLGGGPGLAAAVAIPAWTAKYLGILLTQRQIRELETLIRGEAPTGRQAGQQLAQHRRRPIGSVAAARGALTAGAGSPLAEPPGP